MDIRVVILLAQIILHEIGIIDDQRHIVLLVDMHMREVVDIQPLQGAANRFDTLCASDSGMAT